MYRVWYWAMIDRESDGRFLASIPDLEDLAAYGDTDKDAVAHVTDLASERVRAAVEDGRPVPQGGQARDHPDGSWAPGSVANSAVSHVRLSPAACNG
jgi:predicted RNase H-like HicB family nuclease